MVHGTLIVSSYVCKQKHTNYTARYIRRYILLINSGATKVGHKWYMFTKFYSCPTKLACLCHYTSLEYNNNFSFNVVSTIVTRFAKTRHNDAFLEIQIFA